ncbi:type II toxin-antitoxin system PemK/MazF family toxin [Salicibibacter cibi]|uniref:type II toxin-antitoxin system PemK/MazF family toxin n=1 Tax=Salicibibacter cibi TaxID=2743001 RepID=UPI001907C85B
MLIPVPFTDLSSRKRRPVLVLSNNRYNLKSTDVLVAAVTSNLKEMEHAITISNQDLIDGHLKQTSNIRTDKIYTLAQDIVIKKFGKLNKEVFHQAVRSIHELISE